MKTFYTDPQCSIYLGNAIEVLRSLPKHSIDMCMTSPPYYNLRQYPAGDLIFDGDVKCQHEWKTFGRKLHSGRGDAQSSAKYSEQLSIPDIELSQAFCSKCGAWRGQLGQERTPDEFVSHLCDVFNEVKRILRPTGTLFVNIDDSMSNKSLMGIPGMFVSEMIKRGWLLRNDIIWAKENTMPESVKDRFTCDWEALYFFVCQKKYYFKQQLEPITESSLQRVWYPNYSVKADTGVYAGMSLARQADYFKRVREGNHWRNRRCVWTISTNSPGFEMCQNCHRIYNGAELDSLPKRMVQHTLSGKRPSGKIDQALEGRGLELWRPICHCGASEWVSHYASFPLELCITPILAGCPEGGVVLDPFAGSGTLAVAARRLGRKAVLIDISEVYTKIAAYRMQQEPLPLPVVVDDKLEELTVVRQLRLFGDD